MNGVDANETTLRLERLIAAPPEILFALWLEPAQLAKWWAPDGYEASVDVFEPIPGGRWRVILRSSDGRVAATSGVYRIVEPSRRLVFTWAWEDEHGTRGHETEVNVSFEAAPGGTQLRLVQQRFDSMRARDGHSGGWSASLDRQAKIVAETRGT